MPITAITAGERDTPMGTGDPDRVTRPMVTGPRMQRKPMQDQELMVELVEPVQAEQAHRRHAQVLFRAVK
jgi:hypothetical protein